MTIQLSTGQLRWLRLKSQRLNPRHELAHRDAAQAAAEVVALQAQDPFAAELSLWARSEGLTQVDVEQALFQKRSLVRTWCLRGTLHLVAAPDLGWLLGLLGPVVVAADKNRREALGLDEATCQKGMALLEKILAGQGPLTRTAITARLLELGMRLEGQALPHLLARAAMEGMICLGPGRGTSVTYVLLSEWAPLDGGLARKEALDTLAHRFLKAYAPAAAEDLVVWSGLKMGEVRTAWKIAEKDMVMVTYQDKPLWMLAAQADWLDKLPEKPVGVRLLPAFDTYLLGYRGRDVTIAAQFYQRINAGGGIIHPVVLLDGVAVGGWRLVRSAKETALQVSPFEELPLPAITGIHHEAADLARFLGQPVKVSILRGTDHDC